MNGLFRCRADTGNDTLLITKGRLMPKINRQIRFGGDEPSTEAFILTVCNSSKCLNPFDPRDILRPEDNATKRIV